MKLFVIALVCFSACLADRDGDREKEEKESMHICAKELDIDIDTYNDDIDEKCLIPCLMRRQQYLTGECDINIDKIPSEYNKPILAECMERIYDDDCCKRITKLRSCVDELTKERYKDIE